MDLANVKQSKWSPWNWFKNEQDQGVGAVPVERERQPASRSLSRVHDEIDRLFDNVFSGFGLSSSLLPDWPAATGVLRPQLDIEESRKAYTVRVEVPGVDRDDLDISVENGTLTISGEKQQERSDDSGGFHRVERSYGRFQRVLSLPADADEGGIKARFKNGVLKLTIPRDADKAASGRRIAIEA